MSLTSGIFLIATLGVVSVTDVKRRVIPNQALLAAVAVWLVSKVCSGGEGATTQLFAAVVIASPLLVAALVRPDGMGMGDAKLVAVIGLYLGWPALPALLLGLLLAALTGVMISLGKRIPPSRTTLPLAPFLTIGALPIVLSITNSLQ